VADADVDAATVIRQRGLTELGINIPLPVVHGKVTLKEPVKDRGNHLGCQMSLRTLGWNGFNSAYSSGGESE